MERIRADGEERTESLLRRLGVGKTVVSGVKLSHSKSKPQRLRKSGLCFDCELD